MRVELCMNRVLLTAEYLYLCDAADHRDPLRDARFPRTRRASMAASLTT
jgi:hypothetical protein